MLRYLLPVLFCLCCAFRAEAAETRRAALFTPDTDDRFWAVLTEAAQKAAGDLGMALDIYTVMDDELLALQTARRIVSSSDKPDLAIFVPGRKAGPLTIRAFDDAGVPMMTYNAVLPKEKLNVTGLPRERYEHWIARIRNDDEQAGRDLARSLYKTARRKDKKAAFIAIKGADTVSVSRDRVRGLRKAAALYDDMRVLGKAEGRWHEKGAYIAAKKLLRAHHNVNAIWAVNDFSALGALRAAREAGKTPGEDIFIGGMDWIGDITDHIREGAIAVSYGGHFMDAARALILGFDYLNGYDFAEDTGSDIAIPLAPMDKSNADIYARALHEAAWNRTDYRRLTKTYGGTETPYNLHIDNMLSLESADAQ